MTSVLLKHKLLWAPAQIDLETMLCPAKRGCFKHAAILQNTLGIAGADTLAASAALQKSSNPKSAWGSEILHEPTSGHIYIAVRTGARTLKTKAEVCSKDPQVRLGCAE